MAINIDTVYQRVLAIANKEQRGYITPQEFNLLANQAQLEIFDSYFYEISGNARTDADTVPFTERNTTEGDIKNFLKEKLAIHTTIGTVTSGTTYPTNYMIGKIFQNGRECKRIARNAYENIDLSDRHTTTAMGGTRFYTDSQTNGEDIEVFVNGSQITSSVTCEVITRPASCEWDYVVVNEKALYNSTGSTDFDLHESEEVGLTYKICELAGIVINKPGLSQAVGQINTNIKTEKQQ